jgi:2-methylisocitrate lyase-like PEP mutase family enzyme
MAEPILVLPGVADALTATMAVRAGFRAVFITGAGVANTAYGVPDIGLLSATEMTHAVERIADVVEVPVLADADTGYGNALNVFRTVRAYERAGAAGIMLEDQVTPKKCGHLDGKRLVDAGEMMEKIAAFALARQSELVLMARTDAIAVAGFEEAVRRARLFLSAGADIVFVEAPETEAQLRAIPELVEGPVLANMVEGGKTPLHSAMELQEMGYAAALFANMAMRVGAAATWRALQHLARHGESESLVDVMLPWTDRQDLAGLPLWQERQAALERAAERP